MAAQKHNFTRTSGTLCADQHGCCGSINDGRHINGRIYFEWAHATGNMLFEITQEEERNGFTIAEK